MSPIAVNVIFILDPIVEVILSLFGQRLSLRIGRVEVCLSARTRIYHNCTGAVMDVMKLKAAEFINCPAS